VPRWWPVPGVTITVNDGADTITIDSNGGYDFTPSDHGYSGWTCDNQFAGSSTILATAGVVYAVKIKLPVAATINSIACRITTAGGTLTNAFIGLYDSTGTRRAVSADKSAVWNVAGYYENAMTTPYAAAAGTYYAAVLVRLGDHAADLRPQRQLQHPQRRPDRGGRLPGLVIGHRQTALPSSVTLSGTAALNQNFWFAFK
jgi:hypothetical protein